MKKATVSWIFLIIIVSIVIITNAYLLGVF
jgi:hypothetical protein